MTLISVPIKTFSAEDLVKLEIIISVHYNSDVSQAIKVITETINGFEFVKEKENTKVFVTTFGASSIDLK
jgi:small-conductance mechanosensitive channel